MSDSETESAPNAEYECKDCGAPFRRKDSLRRHVLTTHGPDSPPPKHLLQRVLKAGGAALARGRAGAGKLMDNPIEVSAPKAGKVRIRSIRPGAPSKVDDEEEEIEAEGEDSEVPEAKVRGPKEGPAAVPTAVPARKDRGRKAKAKAEPEVVDE